MSFTWRLQTDIRIVYGVEISLMTTKIDGGRLSDKIIQYWLTKPIWLRNGFESTWADFENLPTEIMVSN